MILKNFNCIKGYLVKYELVFFFCLSVWVILLAVSVFVEVVCV